MTHDVYPDERSFIVNLMHGGLGRYRNSAFGTGGVIFHSGASVHTWPSAPRHPTLRSAGSAQRRSTATRAELTSLSFAALTLFPSFSFRPPPPTRRAGLSGKSLSALLTSFFSALKPFSSPMADLSSVPPLPHSRPRAVLPRGSL
jgi:hypothetical protein